MKRPKLLPEQVQQLLAAKRKGATVAELASRFGVGVATVDRATKAAAKSNQNKAPSLRKPKTPPATPSPPAAPVSPPTESPDAVAAREAFAADLDAFCADIRKDLTELAGRKEYALKNSLNRVLLTAQTLRLKALPPAPPPEAEGAVFVPVPSMQAMKDRVRSRLCALAEDAGKGIAERRRTWAKCGACGQSVEPRS